MHEAGSQRLLPRLSAALAGIWLGGLLTLGAVVAPTAFALFERAVAGRLAGACFRVEAHLALAFAVALFVMERYLARQRAQAAGGSLLSANMLLALGALFCTVVGYFALQPMMEAARLGQPGAVSFGLLHGVSSALYALKGLLVAMLFWRALSRRAA
ncbi:MAG: hypothetical protein RLZZ584_1827 [Pseudomonadota bacterium]|jgi:hypothetical protein